MRGAGSAIARRAFADARVRTGSFAALFAFSALLQATAYGKAYPTLADRIQLTRTVGENTAVRLLYGRPHDLLSVGGYVGWREGGGLALFAAIWGLLAAVRAMRAEEESGRLELLLAGVVSRRRAFAAQLVAIGAGAALLWLAMFAGLVAGDAPVGGSAYLALAIVSVVPVFVGVGAVASQLAPSKRLATGIATGVFAVAFAVRAVADTSSGLGWLRWASPLGWAEELRPFAGPQPSVLLLPAATAALLLAAAAALAARRDTGSGLFSARDSAPPRLGLLGSPPAQALRAERGALIAWLAGVGAFAFLMGVLSSIAESGLSKDAQRQFEKLGTQSLATPSGWLGFAFSLLVVAVSVFCCMQIAATRDEEAGQRLETLLALPLSRRSWLAGRLLVATAGAAAVALAAGVLAWAGAATQGAGLSLPEMLGAGANCLPASLLFLGLGALAFALVPRAAAGAAYGLVGVAFLWQMLGALLEAPGWLLAVSPFHDVGLVPGAPFKAPAAAIMLVLAALAAAAAMRIFERRDLASA